MKPRPARVAIRKHATTTRSARLAAVMSAGSAGSSRWRGGGGPPAVPGAGVPSIDLASAGGGVPITRCRGPAGASRAGPRASRSANRSPAGWLSPGCCPAVESVMGLPVLRSDPQRREHHEQQEPEEGDEPLGDRPDPAQAEPAGVGRGPGLGDVRDDVALLLL